MQTVNEIVKIKNAGDSTAQLNYNIVSARILDAITDNYVASDEVTSKYIEDKISHDYPFHININLEKNFALEGGDTATFEVSISWPLDSGKDALDSEWGTKANKFQQNEILKHQNDNSYQINSAIKIVLSVTAEQYIEGPTASDYNFALGTPIMYDVMNKVRCSVLSTTCLNTYVIDANSTLGDTNVTLLPDLKDNYNNGFFNQYDTLLSSLTATWNATTRALKVEDILKIISRDVTNSYLVRPNLSDSIVGLLSEGTRMSDLINNTINSNGYIKFDNQKFTYFNSAKCYWFKDNYGAKGFALGNIDSTNSKIYGENNDSTTKCSVVPIIIASKANLKI